MKTKLLAFVAALFAAGFAIAQPFGSGVTVQGVQTITGAKTFTDGKLILGGATSGTTTVKATAIAGSGTVTLPTTGTLMVNPMTTGGDVIYGGASGLPTRLANGSNGQVLTSSGTTTAPTWTTPAAAASLTATYIGYGDGSNALTGEAALTYNATTNTLTADHLSDAIGDVRILPQNSKSAAYTTVLADSGKHLLHPSADTTARTITIDSNANVAYPIGTMLTIVNQNAAGVLTIAITSDTMRLAGAGTTGSRTMTANCVATALKIVATEWIISGGSCLSFNFIGDSMPFFATNDAVYSYSAAA